MTKKDVITLIKNLKLCKTYIYYYKLLTMSVLCNDDKPNTIYNYKKGNKKVSITKKELYLKFKNDIETFKKVEINLNERINNFYKIEPYKIVQQYYLNCINQSDLKYYLKYDDIKNYKWYKVNLEVVRSFKNNLNNLNNINKGFITDIFGVKVFWCSFGSPAGYKNGKPTYNDIGMVVYATEPITPKKWTLWLSNRFNQSLKEQHELFLNSTVLYGGKGGDNKSLSNKELLETIRPNEISNYERKLIKNFENWKEQQLNFIEDYKELDNLDDGNRTMSYLNSLYEEWRLKEYNDDGELSIQSLRRLNWIDYKIEEIDKEFMEYNGY